MNRIDLLKQIKRKKLVIYLMAGDPDIAATESLIYMMAAKGVSLIEIGIPFSDPIADGPTIQAAGERALKKNITTGDVLKLVKKVRQKIETPIVAMTYYNLIYNYGTKRFIDDAAKAGLDGAIIPDLPFDEEVSVRKYALKKDFYMIYLAAPTNSRERIKKMVEKTSGFLYYILLKGTTGARERLHYDFKTIKDIKKNGKILVFSGFGISKPEQAKHVLQYTDGVIIGSAFVELMEKYGKSKGKLMKAAGTFVDEFLKEVNNAGKS